MQIVLTSCGHLTSWFPRSRQDSFFPSRFPKLPELSSASSTHQNHEDVLSRKKQAASPGTHSARCRSNRRVGWHVRCFRSGWQCSHFGLSLAPTQQISNQWFLHLCLAVGTTNWDVPFHHQFLDLFGSKPLPTGWEKSLPLGLKLFFLSSEFPHGQSELSCSLAFGLVSGPQQLRHCRLYQLVSPSRTEISTSRDHDLNTTIKTHSVCQRINWPTPPPSNGQQFSSMRSPINSVGQMGQRTLNMTIQTRRCRLNVSCESFVMRRVLRRCGCHGNMMRDR